MYWPGAHNLPLTVLTLLMRVLAKFLYSCMQLLLLKKSLWPLPLHHFTYWSAPPTACQLSVIARMACAATACLQSLYLWQMRPSSPVGRAAFV